MDELNKASGTFAIGEDGREAEQTVPVAAAADYDEGADDEPWRPFRGGMSRTVKHRIRTYGRRSDVQYDYGLPPAVARYLMPQEVSRALAMHKHGAALAGPLAAVAIAYPLAAALNLYLWVNGQAPAAVVHLIWITVLCISAWYGARALAWHCEWFVVTPERIILISGVTKRTVRPLPLKRTRDIELVKSSWGTFLGYGTLHAQSFSTDRQLAKVTFIPDPDGTFNYIWGFMLPNKDDDNKGEGGKK